MTSFQDSALGRDASPLPQEAVTPPVYQLAPQQTVRKVATSYPMSFPKRVPPPVVAPPAPVAPVDPQADPMDAEIEAWRNPAPEPQMTPEQLSPKRDFSNAPVQEPLPHGSWDDKLNSIYGMAEGLGGTKILAPMNMEPAKGLRGGTGDAPAAGFVGDTVSALGEGVANIKRAGQGLAAMGTGLAGMDSASKRYSDIAGNLGKQAAADTSEKGVYHRTVSMIPSLALQIAASVPTGGAGGFLIAAAAEAAGNRYNEGYDAAKAAGMSDRDARSSAWQEGAMGAASSVVANAIPAHVLLAGKTAAAAGVFAKSAAVARRSLNSASANAAISGGSQVAEDFIVGVKRQGQQEFDQFYKDHPEWMKESLDNALKSLAPAALLGGVFGMLHRPGQVTAEKAIESPAALKEIQQKVMKFGWTKETTDEMVSYLDKRAKVAERQVPKDVAFQRAVGQALDLRHIDDAALAAVAAGTDGTQTANIPGVAESWAVTPAMAAQEMAQRAKEANPKHPIVGLEVSPDGSVTDAALSAWVAGSRPVAEGMAKGMSRAQMERATGRKDIRWSAEQRKALSDRIALEVAKPEVAPVAPPRPDVSAEVAGFLKDLSPTERAMALKGLSPDTARLVTQLHAGSRDFLESSIRQQQARYGAEKAPSEAGAVDAPATPGNVPGAPVTDPGPALAALARANKVDPEAVKEAVPDEGQKRIVEFGKSLGVEVRHFDGPEGMTTAGAMHDGVMWLNAATKEPAARWAVAIHETLDSLHAADSGLWKELHAVLKEHAPEALAEAARRYGVRLGEQGGEVTPEVLHREGASNVAEVLVEAFGLHAGIDGTGRVDRAKVAAMVDSNPGVFAKVVRFLRAALAKVGIGRKETGLNDAQAAMLERAIGGKGRELANPGVRRLIATKLADTLNEAMKLKGEPVKSAEITQSIREKSPEKVEQEQAVEKKGIAKGVKVGAAVARAVARRKAADMAFSAQEKINALRERMAASVSDEKLKGRTERKVIKDSIKLAERVVSVLPKDMKGDYLADVAKADTPEKALAVAQDVVHDLAMIPLHDLREKGRKMSERLGAKGISTAAKESARESLDAAHALLTGDRGRLVKYESVEMAAQRKAAAEQHLAAAKQAMDESQLGYKEAVKDRAINLSNDIKAVGAEIAAMKPLAEDADGLGGHRRSPLAVALGSIANKDIHTIGEAVGPTFSRIFSDARSAEGAHDLHHAEVMNKVNAALVEAGFDSPANYGRRAKGDFGDGSVEKVKATIGGKEREIPLGRALYLAMLDGDTVTKLPDEGFGKQGFILSEKRNSVPLVVTKEDIASIRASIDPKILAAADKIKKIVNDETFQRGADATMRLTGRQPKPIDGYLMTMRHGDAVNKADVLDGDNMVAAVVTDLPSMRERVSSSAPFVAMDFMDAISATVEGNLFLIHLAEPGQHAMRVLRSEGVRTGIERAYGEKMNESLRSLLLNGLRITGKPTGDMVERASGMVAGAKVLVNPASLGVQVGGMFRVASEMPPGAMHEGIARSATMSPKERSAYADRMMARNGYLTHRWSESQVGMYAGVLGESASGKAMMKEASRAIRDSAKAATTALAKGRIMEAAKAVGSSVGAAVKFLRSLEQAQRAVDRQIGVSTALGFDAHLRKSQPHLTEAQRFDAAVALTEQAFRRTQNVSSAFDDTMFMANGRQKRNLSRLLFPFTSDPLKGYNQWQRAWASGDPTQIGRTAYALGANAAWGAGMRPLAAAGTLALTGAFSSNDERRKAATRAAITDSAWGAGVRLGGDALSVLAGYQGQMIGSIAQQFVAGRPVDVGGGILAIGAANDAFNSALRGDWLRSGMAASELAGVPLAAVARHGKGAYELATGANEDKQARKQMSKEVREGTASAEVESTLKSDRAKESAAARAYKRGVVTPDLTDAIRSRVDKAIAREKVRKAARSER